MIDRWLVAVLVVAATVAAFPIAQVIPTDETWRAGMYDGGDSDDIVRSVTSASATTDRVAPPLLSPLEVISQIRPGVPLAPPRSHVRSPYHRRAPPSA